MRIIDQDHEMIDLGDAVRETRGSAMVGITDPLGGYRQAAGLSNED